MDPEHRLRHIGFTAQNIDALYHYLGGKDLVRAFRGSVRQALYYSHRAKGDLSAEAREDQITEKNEWAASHLSPDEMAFLIKVEQVRGSKELRDLVRAEEKKPTAFFKKYFLNTLDQLKNILADLSLMVEREGWGQYGILIQPSLEARMGSENVMGSFVSSDLNTGRSEISGYFAPQPAEKTLPLEELPEHLLSQASEVGQTLRELSLDIQWVAFVIINNQFWVDEIREIDSPAPRARLAVLLHHLDKGRVDKKSVLAAFDGPAIETLLEPVPDTEQLKKVHGGRALVHGKVAGRLFLSPESLYKARLRRKSTDERFLLALPEMAPEDLKVIPWADGILLGRENAITDRLRHVFTKPLLIIPELEFLKNGVRLLGKKLSRRSPLTILAETSENPLIGFNEGPLREPNLSENGLARLLEKVAEPVAIKTSIRKPGEGKAAAEWLAGSAVTIDLRDLLEESEGFRLSLEYLFPDYSMPAEQRRVLETGLESYLARAVKTITADPRFKSFTIRLWENPLLRQEDIRPRLGGENLKTVERLLKKHNLSLPLQEPLNTLLMEENVSWFSLQARAVAEGLADRIAQSKEPIHIRYALPPIPYPEELRRILFGTKGGKGVREAVSRILEKNKPEVNAVCLFGMEVRWAWYSYFSDTLARYAEFLSIEPRFGIYDENSEWIRQTIDRARSVRPDLEIELSLPMEAGLEWCRLLREKKIESLVVPRQRMPLFKWALSRES